MIYTRVQSKGVRKKKKRLEVFLLSAHAAIEIFAGFGEGDDDENEDMTFAKLLPHEFEEDNEDEDEERNLQEDIDISEPNHLGHRNGKKYISK
ncbi:hypothetical protein JTB14_007950 [Gonioctena quinquepunctata]|nr:hypothetical protein JTB14_007950 [Gonioctena quinquepunctata]